MEQGHPQKGLAPRRSVFIVDDHPVFRFGLKHLINEYPSLIVCGEFDGIIMYLRK